MTVSHDGCQEIPYACVAVYEQGDSLGTCARCGHHVSKHDFRCGIEGCPNIAIPNSDGDRLLKNGNITGVCEYHANMDLTR